MHFVDSHCHLYYEPVNQDLDGVFSRMSSASVISALCVSVDLSGDEEIDKIVLSQNHIFASSGVHPCEESISTVSMDALLASAQRHDKVVAIGETGLDFFRDPTPENKRDQIHSLVSHIAVAKTLKKPLIIHMRSATDALLDVLMAEDAQDIGGVLHCYTEDRATAKKLLDLGFYISFSGIVTFKKAEELRRVAAYVPADRYLIETDSPYLAPVPHRGKSNEPSFVVHVASYIANTREESLEKVAQDTTENFFRWIGRDILEPIGRGC